ncbi:MAG TPA: cytochrome c peroxidase [Stellaceae bacterium]|nr:cytochrome c peroxidase [Stellaceae bacterium]
MFRFCDVLCRTHATPRRAVIGGLLAAVLCFCGGGRAAASEGGEIGRAQIVRRVAVLTVLGRQMFADPSLSASGKMSCATCHSPARAFGPPNSRSVQLGGKDMRQSGLRAVPSLGYLQATPPFTEHFFDGDDEGDDSVDNGPTGGLTWDGRIDRGRDQARIPLLSPYEMANEDPAKLVARLRRSPSAIAFRQVFGETVFDAPEKVFSAALEAFEVYEQSADEFYPYSSKYDAYLAGRVALTASERRGLALFEDPAKGNCARCHISERANDGTPPQFTDYELVALGVPRNAAIPANKNPAWFDLGMCGPLRDDFRGRAEYCGRFMTPTLRNIATRRVFFHNGAFHSLRQVIEFYVERDTNPGKWYPRRADGRVQKFDDLPERYWANIESDPPFGGHPGDRPALSGSEIDDLIAFLRTLTDGFKPK